MGPFERLGSSTALADVESGLALMPINYWLLQSRLLNQCGTAASLAAALAARNPALSGAGLGGTYTAARL